MKRRTAVSIMESFSEPSARLAQKVRRKIQGLCGWGWPTLGGVVFGLTVLAMSWSPAAAQGGAGEAQATPAAVAQATPGPTTAAPGAAAGAGAGNKVIEERLEADEQVTAGFGFAYNPENRRDPFVNPLARMTSIDDLEERPAGVPGMLVDEVILIGLADTESGPIAIFMGTDNKGYFVRVGDSFWDGQVISIDVNNGTVVVEQKMQDITSPTRSKEKQLKLNP